ncbi:MAG: RidA family protein [Thermomicrobiales bacterium]|nr:RidA family protein [Thermomicrobiales bacterium]
MDRRQHVSSGTTWEMQVGYSRAVRVPAGDVIAVSGTTATDEHGQLVGAGDPEAQTRHIIAKIGRALAELGASLEHVVRTRVYVTNAADWPAIGRAHAAAFGAVRPANTLVEVSALIGEGYLVEIEADAVVPNAE